MNGNDLQDIIKTVIHEATVQTVIVVIDSVGSVFLQPMFYDIIYYRNVD